MNSKEKKGKSGETSEEGGVMKRKRKVSEKESSGFL